MRILVALLAATAILAAGCGGSSNNAADTTTAAADTAAATTDTTSADTTSADTTATDTTSSDGSTSAAGLSEGCQKVADMSKQVSEATGSSTGNAQQDLQNAAAAYKAFAAQAPEEIRGAFTTLADAFAKYADALKGVDLSSGKTPDAATIAKIAQAAQSLSGTELASASAEITAWVTKNCSATG